MTRFRIQCEYNSHSGSELFIIQKRVCGFWMTDKCSDLHDNPTRYHKNIEKAREYAQKLIYEHKKWPWLEKSQNCGGG